MGRLLLIATLATAGCATPPGRGPAPGVPERYECVHVGGPIAIDGHLDEPAWRRASWSEPFGDIRDDSHPEPRHETRMKMVWTDDALYVAARLEEPHICGFLGSRDDIIYRDNDFEVFIDPDGDTRMYYEVEINARNTVMDLLMTRPYNKGGTFELHWNLEGLETAVHVDGTLNDPTDYDEAWTVEMRLPWAALAEHTDMLSPPKPGNTWRINFSRVQWRYDITTREYHKVKKLPEDNWTWSPQGAINMHIPERWGYVEFVD